MQNKADSPGTDSAQWAAQLLLQMATSTNNNLTGSTTNTTTVSGTSNNTMGVDIEQTNPPAIVHAGPTYAGLLPNILFYQADKTYANLINIIDSKSKTDRYCEYTMGYLS